MHPICTRKNGKYQKHGKKDPARRLLKNAQIQGARTAQGTRCKAYGQNKEHSVNLEP